MAEIYELIQGEFYLAFEDDVAERNFTNQVRYYTTDKSFKYTSFFADFGPLDLGHCGRFIEEVNKVVEDAKKNKKPVYYIASTHPHERSNAAVLALSYLIFERKMDVEDAYEPFVGIKPPFYTFRDAGFCINTFPSTVLDCARAMHKAQSLKHYDHSTFNHVQFHSMAKLENGDISWVIPGKFIAFSGPVANRRQLAPNTFTMLPQDYVPLFKKLGVTCIVRFNSKCYDRKIFVTNGIKHVDMLYEDGGNPSEEILQAFLKLCETTKGAIAVHCKAGLGRTGTNIAAYMIKHYQYTTKECVAWTRLCRPGCIVGPQQQFLAANELRLMREGDAARSLMMNSLRDTLPSAVGSPTTPTAQPHAILASLAGGARPSTAESDPSMPDIHSSSTPSSRPSSSVSRNSVGSQSTNNTPVNKRFQSGAVPPLQGTPDKPNGSVNVKTPSRPGSGSNQNSGESRGGNRMRLRIGTAIREDKLSSSAPALMKRGSPKSP